MAQSGDAGTQGTYRSDVEIMPSSAIQFLLFVIPVFDIVATFFFARLFLDSRDPHVPGAGAFWRSRLLGGRSWLLALLTLAFATITVAYFIVEEASPVTRAAGGRHGPPPGTEPWLIGSLIVLGSIPVGFAVAFFRARDRH